LDTHTPFLDRLAVHFFSNEERLIGIFTEPEKARVIRLRALYNEILHSPLSPEVERIKWLRNNFGIQRSQAYYDLADLRAITGAIKFDKESLRYEAILAIKQKMSEAKDGTEWSRHMKNLILVSRLDKDDPEPLDTSKLYPRRMEPTTDVTVLGLPEPEPGLEQKLRERYGQKKYEYEEADFEEIRENPDPIADTPTLIEKQNTHPVNR